MNTFAKGLSAAFCVVSAVGIGGLAMAQPADNICKVTIDRSQPEGVYDVTKVVAEDGDCVCYVYTGPQTQGQGTEDQINALLENKSCPNAKTVNVPKSTAEAGGSGDAGWAAAGAAAAFGAFLAVAADDSDDDSNPVSP